MKKFLNKLQPFLPIFFIGGVLILLFYKVFFLGQVYYDGDNFHLNIPQKYFFVQEILHGRLPLWNPYIFTGLPYFADLNLGTLNPLNILYFLFPVPRALTLVSIIDLFLIGIFQYYLLRLWRLKITASLVGSLIFMLGGSTFVFINNITYLNVIVYIPLLFIVLTKLITTKQQKYIFYLSVVQTLQIFAGHPQVTYYTYIWILFYLLFFSSFQFKTRFILIVYYLIFSLGMASVQLFPFLEYVRQATRPIADNAYAGWGSLTLSGMLVIFFPTIYGVRLLGTWWGPQTMLYGYIGTSSLALLTLGARMGKQIFQKFSLIGAPLSLLIALGSSIPLFYLFYFLLPGFRLLRAPSGMLVYFGFFASILCAYGLTTLLEQPKNFENISKKLFLTLLPLTLLSGAFYFYLQTKQSFWQLLFLSLQKKTHILLLQKVLIYDQQKLFSIFQGILWNVFLFLAILLLTFFTISFLHKRKTIYRFSFILLTLVPFLFFNFQYILTTNLSFWKTNTFIPIVLQTSQKGKSRILSLPVNLHQERIHLPGQNFFYNEGLLNLAIYHEDQAIPQELYQASGYTSLVPKTYALFIQGTSPQQAITNIDFSHLSQLSANLTGIQYILSQEPIKQFNDLSLKLVYEKKGSYYIYQNPTAFPRAYTLFHSGFKNVKILTSSPTFVKIQAFSPFPNNLVLTDWYYPGWRAFVNGKEVPINQFANAFRIIDIPQGNSTIIFVYQPKSIEIGFLATIVSIISLTFLFLIRRKTVLL